MRVGILKRGCANEPHLGHSDPSKYFLDNLGNDRALTIKVSLLNFLFSFLSFFYWLVMPF